MRHWSPEEKQRVADLLKRGMTAGQIARKFAPRSRCAIISLVNRDEGLKRIGFRHSNTHVEPDAVSKYAATRK